MKSYKVILLSFVVLAFAACSNSSREFDIADTIVPLNAKGTVQEDVSNESDPENWFTKDSTLDGVEGCSADKAYATYQDLNPDTVEPIIVAVIDSGVDINHEDLQGRIWHNPGETGQDEEGNDKATNGKDDDDNGYIDDVHGWNFLGGKDGSHIDQETLEVTRELVRYEKRIANGEELTDAEQAYYERVKKTYDAETADSIRAMKILNPIAADVEKHTVLLKERLGMTEFTKETLNAINSADSAVIEARDGLLAVIGRFDSLERFGRILEYYGKKLKYYFNKDFDPRSEIVKDDPSDFSDTDYGNNIVIGPDASHGTHVSGIIAAVRGNDLGINGVAVNAKIMVLRAVPNGDERDKDIALAVRYAVDNGARVINMSFGKSFSPYKVEVDAAFQYAAAKQVLIVNAAGNDDADTDVVESFPNRKLANSVELAQEVPGWINVGASAHYKGLDLPANFSNFGLTSVDLFAPGYQILSTVPGSIYAAFSGTSMAAPVVSGVAAFVLAQYPQITAVQLKAILMETVVVYPGLKVRLPGADQFDLPVLFSGLSVTGGIVNAYEALELTKHLATH